MRNLQGNWLDIAKSLPQGKKVRTTCCGPDRSQIISHTIDGYKAWCFRCCEPLFEPHGLRSIATIQRHKLQREFLEQDEIRLPEDYTLNVPDKAAMWYYQYGISAEVAGAYGIGYSPSLNRIVIPVYKAGELIALQLRAVDSWDKPKYLNPTGPKVSAALFEAGKYTGTTIVVEDILSAIKIGRVHHATALLGTNMTDARANSIAKTNERAYIWLDGDKAGQKGTLKAERKLSMLGVDVRRINTERDPKTYSLDFIRSVMDD